MHLSAERLVHRQQHIVHNQVAVARVVRGKHKFVRMQPQIQRVHHSARHRNAEITFQVRRVVPHQSRHPVAPADSRELQPARQPPRPAIHVAVGAARDRAVRPPRNNLDPAEEFPRALENRHERQRKIHHRSAHESPPKRTCAHPTTNRPAQQMCGHRLPPRGPPPAAMVDCGGQLQQDVPVAGVLA